MKCVVCGKNFNGKECPVCSFPVVEILGDDFEAGMRSLEPEIQKHRREFAKRVTLGVTVYNYEFDTKIVEKGSEIIKLGSIDALQNKTWMNEEFEAVSSRDSLPVNVSVWVDDKMVQQYLVNIPNIKTAEKLRLGVVADDKLNFTMLLSDNASTVVRSPRIPIING